MRTYSTIPTYRNEGNRRGLYSKTNEGSVFDNCDYKTSRIWSKECIMVKRLVGPLHPQSVL